nr:odorant receptor Or1-like [Onthophagus taurus]
MSIPEMDVTSKDIQETVNYMNNPIFKSKTIKHYHLLKKEMDRYYRVWLVYMIICALTCGLWALFPFVDNTVKDKGLPFDYYYPYDRTGKFGYPLTFLYQSLGMFIHGTSHAALDSLYAGMMAFVGVQIDILNDTLENLHEMGNLGGNHGFDSMEKSDKMNCNLVYCIRRHWNILRFVDQLNVYISFTTLIQFGMAGIILCVAMYSMSMLSPTSGKFASDLFYFMAMVSQLSVYCWYGNEIMIKSDLLSSSIYKCDWTDTHLTFKKNVLLFTLFVSSSSKIFAGYFITLSLNTFGGILRASWSYFAVLKNVQE